MLQYWCMTDYVNVRYVQVGGTKCHDQQHLYSHKPLQQVLPIRPSISPFSSSAFPFPYLFPSHFILGAFSLNLATGVMGVL